MTDNILLKEKIYAKGLTQKEYIIQYSRSRKGLVANIYASQRRSSRSRGHNMPDYNLEALRAWVFAQPNFDELYHGWAESGFNTMQIPSCDRLDDYKPYTLDNLRLVTWAENNSRYREDKKSGINNKQSKAVMQLTKEGDLIAEYHSARHASRVTGVSQSHLSACCRGIRKAAGGFVWIFA